MTMGVTGLPGVGVEPYPKIPPEVGVKLQSGYVQHGLAGSFSRRHCGGRLGYLGHLHTDRKETHMGDGRRTGVGEGKGRGELSNYVHL